MRIYWENQKRNQKRNQKKNNKIEIIIPENHTVWFTELSLGEYEDFASLINQLSLITNLKILIKRKKDPSYLEDYIRDNYYSFQDSFSSALGGYMLDFYEQDFILSLGISSIATKASAHFKIPYIIYDKTNRSIDSWNCFYSKSIVKPIFVKNLNDILEYIIK